MRETLVAVGDLFRVVDSDHDDIYRLDFQL